MATIYTGNNTPGYVNVDQNNDMMVTTPQVNSRYGGTVGTPNYVGAIKMFAENDAGSLTGTPDLNSPYVTFENNLQTGMMTPLFEYAFNGTAQDTSMWYYAFSTMTAAQTGGYLIFNSGNIGTTGTGCYLISKRYFNLTGNAGLKLTSIGLINNPPVANELFAWGLGIPASTTTLPTDGIWLQLTSAGLIGVIAYNGTLTQSGVLPVGGVPVSLSVNVNNWFTIRAHDRLVSFWYNDIKLGIITLPPGQPVPFMSDALPIFTQYINTGAVGGSTFMQVKLATITVDQLDSNLGKPYPHIQAAKGLSIYQGLQGGTMGANAFWPSSTNPTAATPVGTALTANLPTSLSGGQGLATLWNLAATDMVMSQAQVPTGSISQTARTLYITGVKVSAVTYTGATWTAPASGTHMWIWGIFYGNTTANPTTAESGTFTTATVKAPRKVLIGSMTWATAATPIGTPPDRGDIIATFQTPLIVNPGEYIQIVAKMINGAASATGNLFFTYMFDGYWE